ncbi:MAG: transposase [Sulfolobus sp.]|nr:transposase [Sulfolobus sp.]
MPTVPVLKRTIIPSPDDGGVEGSTTKRIGISWGKTAPLVYTWTRGAGLALKAPASYDSVKMKRIDQKPMNRSKGTLAL